MASTRLLWLTGQRRFKDKDSKYPTSDAFKAKTASTWLVEVLLYVRRNRRFIRDGSPGQSTSTFTQLLSSVNDVCVLDVFEGVELTT